MRERRRNYELMFIISPLAANDEGINAAIDRVSQTITANGGEVSTVNHSAPWGRRKFAYPIREYVIGEASRRNFTEGYYVLVHFNLPADAVLEVERTLKLSDTVLRHLITVIEKPGAIIAADLADESDDADLDDEDLDADEDSDDE